MKKIIDGTVCFLAAIVPMNIIFTVRHAVHYYETWDWSNWVAISIMALLTLIGLLGHVLLSVDNITPNKHQLGQKYTVKEIKDLTGKQYLTQFSLFILTAFAIPFTMPWIDLGFILFVEFAICVVYVNCKMFYINPFVHIFGYKIYEATFYNQKTEANVTFYVFTRIELKDLENQEINLKHSDSRIIRIKGKGVK
jgi:hypothetical protein